MMKKRYLILLLNLLIFNLMGTTYATSIVPLYFDSMEDAYNAFMSATAQSHSPSSGYNCISYENEKTYVGYATYQILGPYVDGIIWCYMVNHCGEEYNTGVTKTQYYKNYSSASNAYQGNRIYNCIGKQRGQ